MTLDTEQITQEDGQIHAYGDGSYSGRTKKIGSGVIIATQNTNAPIEISFSIHANDADPNQNRKLKDIYNSANFKHASRVYYAEYMAAIIALEALPEGSRVLYHTDENSVYNTILRLTNSTKETISENRGNHQKVERILIDRLSKAVERHLSVDVIMATDKPDRAEKMGQNLKTTHYMTLAHNKACKSSGSLNAKPTQPFQQHSWPPRVR